MKARRMDDETIDRLVLRRLPDGTQLEELEERLIADDELFSKALVAEDDLLDAYGRRQLDAERRSVIESIGSRDPRFAQRMRFAETLATRAASSRIENPNVISIESSPLWRSRKIRYFAAAALVAPMLAGLVWVSRPKGSVDQIAQQRKVEKRLPSPQPLPSPKSRIVNLALTLAVTRSNASVPSITLSDADQLKLAVAVPNSEPAKKFELTLNGPDGRKVWGPENVARKSDGGFDLTIARKDLPGAGRYELGVKGVDDSGHREQLAYLEFEVK